MKHFIILMACLVFFNVHLIGQTGKTTLFKPTPNWIKTYPKPELQQNYGLDRVTVHDESQYNHVLHESYKRYFLYINRQDGILDYYYIDFEMDFQTVLLHKVVIHRNDKRIELEENLHTELVTSDEKIGGDKYYKSGKLKIHFDNLQVGDLVEIAYSVNGEQVDLQNWLAKSKNLEGTQFIGTDYFRILSDKNDFFDYKLLNTNEQPTIKTNGNYQDFELITTTYEPMKASDKAWFIPYKKIYVTNQRDWKSIVDINLKNHQLEIPPSKAIQNKVKSLTKNSKNKTEKIIAILDFVQRDIEYLWYGLINPKRTELTLEKGYGDCKSMSLLTIKMLECIGVEAYPVLVHLNGIDDRLIHSHAFVFDHEIIEFIHESDTILFDATADFRENKALKRQIKDYRFGLKVVEGVNELSRFKDIKTSKIIYNETVKIKRNYLDELEYKSQKEIEIFGDLAEKFQLLEKDYRYQMVWEYGFQDYYPNVWCSYNYPSTEFSEENGIKKFILRNETTQCPTSTANYSNDELSIYPNLLESWWRNFDVQKDSRIFEILPFQDVVFNYTIELPEAVAIENYSASFSNEYWEYEQKFRQEGTIIYATYRVKIFQSYLPKTAFKDVKNQIDDIQNNMKIRFSQDDFPKMPNWQKPQVYQSVLVAIITLFIFGSLIFWVIRTLRKRKKRILELEEEVERLKQ